MSLRRSMFLRLLKRGLLERGDRPLIAFIALAVASTMITAMLSLYQGLENKLNRDFRSYGANVTVAASQGQMLPENSASKVESLLGSGSIVVPFAFAIAHANGNAVVVAGTDMVKVQRLDPWWSVSNWPKTAEEALVGARVESRLNRSASGFDLEFGGRTVHVVQAGILRTGADEESRIYIPITVFASWTGKQPALLEISVPGSRADVNAAIARLRAAFPEMEVRPVRQLLAAEGAVIGRMRSVMLACTLLITFTVIVCVLSTLTASVMERRRDFAVMKAIGSSQKTVNTLFAGEALTIALVAALIGYGLGSGVTAWISEANFHTSLLPRISTLPAVIAASIILALLSALVPLARLQRIEPAGILKGE